MNTFATAMKMLGRRDRSVADLRARLLERDHPSDEVEAAIARLIDSGALDDRRVARAYARTASKVKGRGRLRVSRELQAMGIDRTVAAEAVAEVFGETDERALIERALHRKLRGGRPPATVQERARIYQHLMRQGFTPGAIAAAMRKIGGQGSED